MIPLRVQLRGFMSYRDEATFNFEGSKLWMLSGPNGAGKSTVFDAIGWVLYGVHRGGKQKAHELINQGSSTLAVEFDFRIGEDDYRVRRTLGKTGKPTFQAWHLKGPNPPSGKGVPGEARVITNTDYKDGFEEWIKQTIGLDDLTFTASVMLQQGKSDALLEADPKKRHEMLSQIVGLEAYERLHEKADSERKAFEGAAKNLQAQLAGLTLVDEAQITQAEAQAKEWEVQAKAAHETHLQWTQLLVRAERWQELREEQDAIENHLREAKELFSRAENIEADAARFSDLTATLPHLREVWQERKRLRECDGLIGQKTAQQQATQDAFEKAKARFEQAKQSQADLQKQHSETQARRDEAREQEVELRGHLGPLDELENARRELQSLDAELSRFAADLDSRLTLAREVAERGQEIKNALPWLRQFASSRASFRNLKNEAKQTEAELQAKRADLEKALKRLSEVEEREPQLRQEVLNAQARATELQTLREQIRKRVERLKSQENLAECEYCGQPLTAEHIETEKNRIRGEFTQAGEELQVAQSKRDELQTEQAELQSESKVLNIRLQRLNEDIYRLDCNVTKARELGMTEKQRGEEAFAALPPEYQLKIDDSGEGKWNQLAISFYPGDDDLREAAQRAQEATAAQAKLQTLQNQKAERDELRARRAPFESIRLAKESEYPPEREAEIRQAHRQAKSELEDATQALQLLEAPLQSAVREAETAQSQIEATREKQQQAQSEVAQESARREGIERALQNALKNVPASWQNATENLSATQLEEWQSEMASLQGADEKLALLQAAQRDNAGQLKRLRQIEDESDNIPVAARRSAEDVAREENQARGEHENALAQQRTFEKEKQRLEDLKQRRVEAEKNLKKVEKQAQLYKILAEYLGRDRLQRFLLQQAESGIVSNANQVLDRISGGSLRLELRHDGNEPAAKKVTALDLLAFNSEAGTDPMPVYLLSGSQRFRVAVSLALGIGQFAGTGTRRIESVIIDEGFGSLDQEGRREIIDELHNLKEELSRIILVSHQDEFADAFPHRYGIELQNGSSVVTLMDEA
jgi:exonuclease SbcC